MAPNELPEQVLSLSFLGVIHLLSPLAFPTFGTQTPQTPHQMHTSEPSINPNKEAYSSL